MWPLLSCNYNNTSSNNNNNNNKNKSEFQIGNISIKLKQNPQDWKKWISWYIICWSSFLQCKLKTGFKD